MAATGKILFTTTAEEQIKKGRLCELEIFYNVYNQKLYNDFDSDVNYHEMYKACITENQDRNLNFIVKPALEMIAEGRHVLILIQFIEHGQILKDMFYENGLSPADVRFIWGDTPDKIRQSAISEFRKGEFKVMIGSTIFDAGVNIPVISGVVLGGAGNSDITLIQRIGRGARNCDYEKSIGYLPDFMKKAHGKKVTKVYDVMDINAKFFHKQALNRYYNARDEFGKDRVMLIGDKSALKRKSKSSSQISQSLDQMAAQLEMLRQFTE
jgi:superfamily II DNA or RNA helicase